MASAAAIQKRESAVLGKIQTELAYFVDRGSMSVSGNKNAHVPEEFNLDSFQIVDGDSDFTPVYQVLNTQEVDCSASPPAGDERSGFSESLEWFGRLLETATSAPCAA